MQKILIVDSDYSKVGFEVLARNKDFQADAESINSIEQQDLDRLISLLDSLDSAFLSKSELLEKTKELISSDVSARKIASFLYNLHRIVQDNGIDIGKFIENSRDELKRTTQNNEWLQAFDINRLFERTRQLFNTKASKAISRQIKARQLSSETGMLLKETKVICDMRPVFDNKRTRIDGIIPMITLRLCYEESDEGLSKHIDIRLEPEQVEKLIRQFNEAKTKLDTITNLLNEKALSYPEFV